MTTMLIDRIRIKELEETIANSTPLLAVVGAGDLAIEKFRAARDELAGRAADFDPKAFRDQAQASIADRVESFQADMMSAPEQIRALPERAQEWPVRAQSLFADVLSAAFTTYGELAGRGKSRVTQVRRDVPDAVRVDVDVDVTPVSRPAASPLRTRPVAKRPAAKRSTTSTTTAKKANTAKKSAAKKTNTAKKSAAKKSTTATTAAKKTATKKTTPAKTSAAKSADTSS